ncbi:MAG: flagellar protein FlgN [Desulfatitalea sp.]|nr:flagellar protein FlgN [Desulfatitalea sp.]
MEQWVEQLIVVLDHTHNAYSRLLEVVEQEKQAAIVADLQAIAMAGEAKQVLVAQIERHEQQRTRLLQQLAKGMGLPFGQMHLSTLADRVGGAHRAQLQQLHGDLNILLEKVHTANAECRTLIDHCLRVVQNTLGFFQHWMGATEVYGQSGNMRNEALQGGRLLSGRGMYA